MKKCKFCENVSVTFYRGDKTLGLSSQFKDENGKDHFHDGNIDIFNYQCSNNHDWSEKIQNNCWCGWPENQEYKPTKRQDLSYFPET